MEPHLGLLGKASGGRTKGSCFPAWHIPSPAFISILPFLATANVFLLKIRAKSLDTMGSYLQPNRRWVHIWSM